MIDTCKVCGKLLNRNTKSKLCHLHSQKKGKDHYRKKGMFIGENSGNWQGGRRVNSQGYCEILSHGHPFAQKHTGYVVEHRLIVEKFIKRYLELPEEVHHVNHIRTDNSIFNLMVFTNKSAHRRFEKGGKVSHNEIIFDGRKLC